MKHLLILTIGFCLLFTSLPAMADQSADEAAIRNQMEKARAAYNSQDAEAIAATFDDMSFTGFGGTSRSRAEAQKGYTEYFEKNKTIHYEQIEEIGIDFATSEVAILRIKGEYTGGIGADGKPQQPRKTMGAVVMVKKAGEWLVKAVLEVPVEE